MHNYLNHLIEASLNSIKIKLLNPTETKKFISAIKDATSKYNQSNYNIYGAMNKGIIIGGVVINTRPDLKVYKKYKLKCEAAVSFMYIQHKYRKMGLGQKLLNIPMKKYKSLCGTTNKGYTSEGAYELFKHDFRIIEDKGRTSYWYWSR